MSSTFRRQDSDYGDQIDPDLPPGLWITGREFAQWRAGIYSDQLRRRRKRESRDVAKQIKAIQKKHDLEMREIALKYDREDEINCLYLATQINTIDREFEQMTQFVRIIRLIIVLIFICSLSLCYIMALCKSGHYYTASCFMLFILLGICRLYYDGKLFPRKTTPLKTTKSDE